MQDRKKLKIFQKNTLTHPTTVICVWPCTPVCPFAAAGLSFCSSPCPFSHRRGPSWPRRFQNTP